MSEDDEPRGRAATAKPWQRPGKPRAGGQDRHRPGRAEGRSPGRPYTGPGRDAFEPDGPTRLYGIHAVEAALGNPGRVLSRLALTENAEHRLTEALARRRNDGTLPVIERVSPRDLDRQLGANTVHQGALLETEPLAEPALASLVEGARGRPLLLLDQITDPHNVGAILRSAAAFGTAGVVMTRRHSPPLDGALAKAASGALELVAIAPVGNLAQAMQTLRGLGVTLIGLDGEAEAAIEEEPALAGRAGPYALVLGAEGKGLRALTRQTCDRHVCIRTEAALASLNVSNAAAIALHQAGLARRNSG
jgi:23S rRNA (guanosine2251-2'-O)-methyltransferase